jgi:hypothetical protein
MHPRFPAQCLDRRIAGPFEEGSGKMSVFALDCSRRDGGLRGGNIGLIPRR